jgi:alpha-beta hydrolase superfamily lysophospholipase
MRRALLALTAGGLLLLSAACTADSPAPQAGAASSAPVVVLPPSPSAPSAADAKACNDFMAAVEGALPKFGEDLGKVIGAKDQKDDARAKQARDDARKRLEDLAKQMRDTTANADPALRTAAAEAAANVERSAKDAEFFKKLETIDENWSATLQQAATGWMLPVTTVCV